MTTIDQKAPRPGYMLGAMHDAENLLMRHQELYLKRSAELTHAFSNMIQCTDCNSKQPMKIKTIYSALYRGRDILFFQCEDCGAEKAEFATHH